LPPKDQIFELETRRQIYNFILKYPGLHFRKLSRKLNIPKTTLSYHLRYLQKRGLLTAKPEGKFTPYYVSNNIGNGQKKMLRLLRQEPSRNIILYLLFTACASQIELSRSLEKHPTTIKLHLKKLIDMDIIEPAPVANGEVSVEQGDLKIIERTPVGNEIIYRLKDPHSIEDSVLLYRKRSFGDNFSFLPSIGFEFYSSLNVQITRGKNFKDSIESLEEIYFDIFPHPYHV